MATCISPFYKKETGLSFPCGKCYPCKARRVSGWSFRLIQEAKRSDSALFITLTYSNDTVPITGKGYMTLRKKDVQLFMKRLRKYSLRSKKIGGLAVGKPTYKKIKSKQSPPKKSIKKQSQKSNIKYYLAGEYGGKTNRPHYHIILFNAKFEHVEATWQLGDVWYGELSEASAAYTLKYISKESRIPMHQNDDRVPEFSLMSKGLGENYLTTHVKNYHIKGMQNRFYLTVPGGKKVAIPRYYKQKIWPNITYIDPNGEEKQMTNPVLQYIGSQFFNKSIKNYAEKNSAQKLAFEKQEDQLRLYYSSINKETRTTIL